MGNVKFKNVEISKNVITAILGSNCSGRTKLAKELRKELVGSTIIYMYPKDRGYMELIKNYLNKKNIDEFKKLINQLDVQKLLDCSFNTLSLGEKQVIQLLGTLTMGYDIIIMYEAISMVSSLNKEIILKYLKNQKHKTTIIVTSNLEDIMYSSNLILMHSGDVILADTTYNSFVDEKSFRKAGFDLPFMGQLSLKLKYYDLVNKPINNIDSMVNKIWK